MDTQTIDYNTLPYFGFDFEEFTVSSDMNNKLFCTFVTEPLIEQTVQLIQDSYQILYDKIFINSALWIQKPPFLIGSFLIVSQSLFTMIASSTKYPFI